MPQPCKIITEGIGRCQRRRETIIPSLLEQHGAILTGIYEVIDLSNAENCLLQEDVRLKVNEQVENITATDLSYATGIGGSPKARQLLASAINDQFNPTCEILENNIVLTAGGSFALEALVEQICDPGDGILIATPYWSGLNLSIQIRSDATVISVDGIPLNQFFDPQSVEYYEHQLHASSVPVKAILVCNPHNPLGQCYPKATLTALLQFCQRNNLHYISDEVYALSVHAPESTCNGNIEEERLHDQTPMHAFTSILSVEPPNETVHVIYSLSKDFACSGLRMGAFITHNDALRLSGALTAHQQVSNIAASFAVSHLLSKETVEFVRTENGKRLLKAYQTIRNILHDRKIPFIQANAGMFVFARLCPGRDNFAEDKFNQLLRKHGVSLASGTSYHFKDEVGWYRICYSVAPEVLMEAFTRIDRCIREFEEIQDDGLEKNRGGNQVKIQA
ncbi:hypothetical protein ZTR_10278 [Talaromyces verruculosus]|nr:hypothetical protein ZTR_10278 [Talaromyces verruculosus]